MNAKIRYAIRNDRESHGARTFYWAKSVGEVTPRISSAWKTSRREIAERLAAEIGGTIVEVGS